MSSTVTVDVQQSAGKYSAEKQEAWCPLLEALPSHRSLSSCVQPHHGIVQG